ncbi:hypothetical protein BYT27DRAFT_7213730 [Phlegmacium glaucopus]|nr:hypothetical protein BYT27DRAFT_7213730 [Phlegmacium glaucopus]
MLLPLIFLKLSFLLSNVAALAIMIQPQTIVGQSSLVLWTREPSDGSGALIFDLRFVGPGNQDLGLALANIQASPSTQFNSVQVVFPAPGPYVLVAVSGPDATPLGRSNQVNALVFPLHPTISVPPTSTSQLVPSSGAQRNKNIGAIVGGTLGGLALLGFLVLLVIVLLRRYHRPSTEHKRWTFHRDLMVRPTVPEIYSTSPTSSEYSTSTDMEQGLPQNIPPAMKATPIGPRPLFRPFFRPLPQAPLTARQESIVERMEQVRHHMMALERNPGPTQHIILDDLQKQMSWLQDQLVAPWARGLTDVTPLGFSHNLIP